MIFHAMDVTVYAKSSSFFFCYSHALFIFPQQISLIWLPVLLIHSRDNNIINLVMYCHRRVIRSQLECQEKTRLIFPGSCQCCAFPSSDRTLIQPVNNTSIIGKGGALVERWRKARPVNPHSSGKWLLNQRACILLWRTDSGQPGVMPEEISWTKLSLWHHQW